MGQEQSSALGAWQGTCSGPLPQKRSLAGALSVHCQCMTSGTPCPSNSLQAGVSPGALGLCPLRLLYLCMVGAPDLVFWAWHILFMGSYFKAQLTISQEQSMNAVF